MKTHCQIFILIALVSCKNLTQEEEKTTYRNFLSKKDTTFHYAKRFSVEENEKFKLIFLFGNTNIKDTTAIYIVLKDSTLKLNKYKNEYILKANCKKIASLSSLYTNMFYELGSMENVVAVDNIDYYNNNSIIKQFKNQKLVELLKGPEIDVEKTIVLNPDIIFSFGMGNAKKDINKKIEQANIPTVICLDHLEETPLARAEWIKFYAAFVGKEKLADSIFKTIKKKYLNLKALAATAKIEPTVFTEIKYGDVWYVPGGKSYVAALLNDANAHYVFTKAKDAQYWLNPAMVNSKKQILGFEQRYAEFRAFKDGNLYNNNKNINDKGYSDYWETGIIHPDRVLSDLILIFHPELKADLKSELNYYKKIN